MAPKRETRIVFLIPASSAWENELDRKAQEESWASAIPPHMRVIWYVGRPGGVEELVGRVLFLNCEDGYANILSKTIHAVRWLIENVDFDVVIRTNVSTYFELYRTQNIVNSFKRDTPEVGGFLDQVKKTMDDSTVTQSFITGTGIVVTWAAAKLLATSNLESVVGAPDDVAISSFFRENDIRLTPLSRGNFSVTRVFIPSWQIRLKASDNPYLASKRFVLVHKYFNSKNLMTRVVNYLRIHFNEFRNFRWDKNYVWTYLRNLLHILKLNTLRKLLEHE